MTVQRIIESVRDPTKSAHRKNASSEPKLVEILVKTKSVKFSPVKVDQAASPAQY